MSLKRNVAWNLAGTGLPLLLGLTAIPYLVKHIGVEAFGILTLVWTLIGYFSLFDFGLGRALTQQVAVSLAAGRHQNIPHLVKSGLIFTLVTGVIGGLVLAAVSFPLGYSWLKVSGPLQSQTAYSLLIAAVGIPLTTTTTGLRGVLEAYEDFKTVNLLRIILGTANFALPVFSVMFFGPSLLYIVATLILARLVVLVAYWMCVDNKLASRWHKAQSRARHVKRLVSFGAWMTVSNIINPVMVSADRFLIAAVVGTSAVAYYTVPFEILIRVLVIPGALTGALFPRLASTLKSDPAVAHMLYRRSIKIVSITLAAICTAIAIGSYWGLAIWLGADFAAQSWLIASILSVGILLNGIAFVPFAAIQAAGNARTTAALHIAQLLIYVPLLFLFVYFFGVAGAAIAWVIRAALDLVLLLIYAKRTAEMVV
ncbi:flippase [Pollutimonas bauzanensis]|uniref:Membrane protein involved in the export of O-antigen and teichoic acid n=1 Tax=Pollutimonas bauzanensis TaxID=658167 RepID=A0A1M6BKZ1_9BURK|nr:flippase [Pollutimonas bauzanensis]SHI49381.1 Membrane protein involved in the export of O-antigen and teichoic acid [Pollutimonas bauzanensis]